MTRLTETFPQLQRNRGNIPTILPGWLVVCKQCESHRNIHTTATKSWKYSHSLLAVEKISLNTSFSKGELGKLSIDAQVDTIAKILSDATNYKIPDDDAKICNTIVKLAQYACSLEEEISALKPKEMSPQQLEVAAMKIASAACSGIKKQMSVSHISYHSFAILKGMPVETVMQDWWHQVGL